MIITWNPQWGPYRIGPGDVYQAKWMAADGGFTQTWLLRDRHGKYYYLHMGEGWQYFEGGKSSLLSRAQPLAAETEEEAKAACIALWRLEGT